MKKIRNRSVSVLLIAFLVICGMIVYVLRYVDDGRDWALYFSRSNSEMELIARKIIFTLEGGVPSDEALAEYADPDSTRYQNMIDGICKKLGFTSLRYHRLDDLITAIGLDESEICTYCWNGK